MDRTDHAALEYALRNLKAIISVALLAATMAIPVVAAEGVVFKATIAQVETDLPLMQTEPVRPFLLLHVDRVLSGEKMPEKLLLGVRLDGEGIGFKRVSPTEDRLDSRIWRIGATVVVVARRFSDSSHKASCSPIPADVVTPEITSFPDWANRIEWRNARLDAMRPIPLYCASIQDVFPVRK